MKKALLVVLLGLMFFGCSDSNQSSDEVKAPVVQMNEPSSEMAAPVDSEEATTDEGAEESVEEAQE